MAKIKTSDKITKREAILSEAIMLFKEKGYKAASMRDLAGKVGVEAASLYNHISSKGELLNLICAKVGEHFFEIMEAVEKEEISIIKKIEKLLRFHVKQMIENYEAVYVCDREWRNLDEPDLTRTREARRWYRKRFAEIVQQGIDEKTIKPIDANTAVMIFLNAISAVDQWHRVVHKVGSKEMEDNMITILINGLKK